ncbi:MAG: hypothetical protein UZ22_OP11002000414 [Microgenomates bacterium OLB23]|nr:MAG: hypothetical protein UZ22_OP11002000414 [Microgenomates bacterium OLB23]
MKPGEEVTFYVTMSGDPAYALDTHITYDPEYVAIRNVQNGDMFDRVILNEIKTNTIVFSAAYDPGKTTFKQEGIAFTFTAKALKKTQETLLLFDLKNTIAAQDGTNILKNAEPATIHIFD